jgi:P4 family phage/plasmid primase-like protien
MDHPLITQLQQRYSPYLTPNTLPNSQGAYLLLSHAPTPNTWRNYHAPIQAIAQTLNPILNSISPPDPSSPYLTTAPRQLYSSLAIFKTPPTTLNGRGTSADVLGSMYLWVDLDIYRLQYATPHQAGQPADGTTVLQRPPTKDEAIEALEQFTPNPTYIVDSGQGLYAIWQLDSLVTNQEAIESRNRWLQQSLLQYGADHCHNWDRVLRVPNSLNAKQDPPLQCRVIRYDATNVYTLDDFYTASPQLAYDYQPIDPEPLPSNLIEQVQGLKPWLWQRIETEEGARLVGAALTGQGRVDRSINDYTIACRLLDAPFLYTPGMVASVLSHPDWFSGNRRRDARNGGWGYVERTILAAQAQVELQRAQAEQMGTLFVDSGNGPKFSAFRAQTVFIENFHVRLYHKQLHYYDEPTGLYIPEGSRFVPSLLAAALQDAYVSRHAEETEKQLLQLAPTAVQTDEQWLNLQNGLYHVITGAFMPGHHAGVFTTDQLPVTYAPEPEVNASALATLDDFVFSVIGEEGAKLWWEFVGHCLTREVIQPGMLFLYGPPRTGKSQLLTLLHRFLGAGNVSSADVVDLRDESFSAVNLVDKRANICYDTTASIYVERTGFLKRVVSGEYVTVAAKYQQPFDAIITAKLFFATNQPVFARNPDEGWLRRVFTLTCHNIWQPSNPKFRAGIGAALGSSDVIRTAMLHRAIEGLNSLRKRREYIALAKVDADRDQMREDSDSVLSWWKECTEESPKGRIQVGIVNKEYQAYCKQRNSMPLSEPHFRQRTEELVNTGHMPKVEKKSAAMPELGGARLCWVGRSLKEQFADSLTIKTPEGSTTVYGNGGKK